MRRTIQNCVMNDEETCYQKNYKTKNSRFFFILYFKISRYDSGCVPLSKTSSNLDPYHGLFNPISDRRGEGVYLTSIVFK